MPEERGCHYVSSAVVAVLPGRAAAVAEAIGRLDRVEIHACDGRRIVVVMEGSSGGEMGARLNAIANLDGVIAANLVFEHAEELGSPEA